MATWKMSVGIAAMAILAASPGANAGKGITVQVNQAKIVKLARPADTIVVGNPKIADASVQDASTIVLTGKGFGVTNLVVLDQSGQPIVDEQISVSRDTTDSVRVFRRAEVQTLHCTPVCETAYRPGADGASAEAEAGTQ
jgi:Flp pilus assembly secretin CpaC